MPISLRVLLRVERECRVNDQVSESQDAVLPLQRTVDLAFEVLPFESRGSGDGAEAQNEATRNGCTQQSLWRPCLPSPPNSGGGSTGSAGRPWLLKSTDPLLVPSAIAVYRCGNGCIVIPIGFNSRI